MMGAFLMTLNDLVTISIVVFVALAALAEWFSGRSANGARTRRDWQMAGLTVAMMMAVQRQLLCLHRFGVIWFDLD